MKTLSYILTLSFCLRWQMAFAHEVDVHRAITAHAAASAFADSSAYAGFVDVVASDCAYAIAVESLVDGSEREDDIKGSLLTIYTNPAVR